jgi:hypothetical protein
MVRVLLISLVAACSGASGTAAIPQSPVASAETLWDQGTFIVVDKEKVDPDAEETFELYRSDDGFRLVVRWKRLLPTGEPASGAITLRTDEQFSPLSGEDEMELRGTSGPEITRSTIYREPDGRITTEVIAADGKKKSVTSLRRNDWFIGEMFTSFLNVMCHADAGLTNPTIYPDKRTVLEPARPMAIEGTTRKLTYRKLTYVLSKNEVIVACEDGKLAGEVTRGTTIVRSGDLTLARELEKRFR